MKTKYTKLVLVSLLLTGATSLASLDVGYIDSTSHYSKVCHDVSCSSYGNINFLPTQTNATSPVVITDTAITGYLWGDELGWINLAPTGAGVTVDPNTGILYGTAFSQSSGWVNFRPTKGGVVINANGELSGYAWNGGEYGGWIKFDCADSASCVKTNWRILSQRSSPIVNSPGSSYFAPAENTTNPAPTPVPLATTTIKVINDPVTKGLGPVVSPSIKQTGVQKVSIQSKPSSIAVAEKVISNLFASSTFIQNTPTNTPVIGNVLKTKANPKIEIKKETKNKQAVGGVAEKIKSYSFFILLKVESYLMFGWGSLFPFTKIF